MSDAATCGACGKNFDSQRALSLHNTHMGDKLVHNRFALLDSYIIKDQTQQEVADELDTSYASVNEYVQRFGLSKDRSEVLVEMWRNKPVHYRTGTHGYEHVSNTFRGDDATVKIHRLVAVAEYGFGRVADNDINHIVPIPWLNLPSNLEPLSHSEHGKMHANEQHGNRVPEWKDKGVDGILWGDSDE